MLIELSERATQNQQKYLFAKPDQLETQPWLPAHGRHQIEEVTGRHYLVSCPDKKELLHSYVLAITWLNCTWLNFVATCENS